MLLTAEKVLSLPVGSVVLPVSITQVAKTLFRTSQALTMSENGKLRCFLLSFSKLEELAIWFGDEYISIGGNKCFS